MIEYPRLCEAINQRKQVEFFYKSRWWRVEPYRIGYTEFGDMVLEGWVEGDDTCQGWQQFIIPLIAKVSVSRQGSFRPRADYDPYEGAITRVVWRLDNCVVHY